MSIKINIDYIPNPTALKFHKSPERVRCLSGGYGSGKTTAGFIEVLKLCSIQNNVGMFLRKTYLELQMLVNEFETFVDRYNLRDYYKYYEKKQKIELFNNIIYLRSCDDPKKLKQLNLGWCLIDEAIEIEKEYYDEILNGRLRLHNNTKMILLTNPSTPEHWIYQEFLSGRMQMFEMSTFENAHNLPKDFIENAKQMEKIDYDYYAQNYLGKWVSSKGQVLWGVKEYQDNYNYTFRNSQILIGIDWGYSPDYTAVIFIEARFSDLGKYEMIQKRQYLKEFIIFDCIYTQEKITRQIIEMIEDRLKYYNISKNEVIVYADNAEPDRIAEMLMNGFKFGKTIKRIVDTYGREKEVFKDAYEYINTHNVYYLKHLDNVRREITLFRFKKKDDGTYSDIVDKKHKHVADAIRYAVYSYSKEIEVSIKNEMALEAYLKMNQDEFELEDIRSRKWD